MDHKKEFKLLGGLVFLMLLTEALGFNRQYLVQAFSGLEQRRLPVSEAMLYQYIYQDDLLIPQGTNPRIKFENVDTQIRSISIRCQHTFTSHAGRVFYRNDNQPFSILNSEPFTPHYNGSEIIVYLPKAPFVSDLRMTLSDRKGDTLRCLEFVINPYSHLRFTLARLTLYVCILALAVFELFKSPQPGPGVSLRRWSSSIKQNWEKFAHIFDNRAAVILAAIWILLWLLPWAGWLDALPWLRSGLSLLLFVTPGMLLSLLLTRGRFTLLAHFVSGLALSVFWVGALGLTGRIFHWRFEYVKLLFALSGLVELLFIIPYSASARHLFKTSRLSGKTLIFLLFMIVFGVLTNLPVMHSTDDFSFVAYLTNWQHAQQLDFREVFYGTGTADSLRFWFGMFPMSLALLADISHLHGLLLIGIYLEPFLVVVVILATYALYEDLLSSQDQAIIATLLQFTFLFVLRQVYQPGFMMFTRPSDDKVLAAFVLAPVFFLALRYFLDSSHWRSGLFFLLAGSSLALTHLIILAYSVFIAGIWAAIETLIRKEYSKLRTVTILLVLIIAPSASLRFIDDAWVTRSIFKLEPTIDMQNTFSLSAARDDSVTVDTLISDIKGTPFYGFNLERIQIILDGKPENPLLIFLSWSYLWILILGFLWSLFNFKKDAAAAFVAATSLLVLLSAIPYTGWLLGYFVSARMLWRTPWLLPIGLISFFLLRDFSGMIEKRVLANRQFRVKAKNLLYTLIPVACLILMTGLYEIVFQYQGMQKEALGRYRDQLTALVKLGGYLDNNIDAPTRFVARPKLMPYLPGLSAKAKVVVFRLKEWAPYPVDENDIRSLISKNLSISIKQRMQIFEKYNIEYIVTEDSTLKDYYVNQSNSFSAQNADGFWLLHFQE